MTYPNLPGFRDNGTSRAAAELIAPHACTLKAVVLEHLFLHGPMTAWEVADSSGVEFSAIQPRLSELKKLGSLRWNGQTRQSGRSQAQAKVWEIVLPQHEDVLEAA